jgi:L-amino acid N-acyltransferase YncA
MKLLTFLGIALEETLKALHSLADLFDRAGKMDTDVSLISRTEEKAAHLYKTAGFKRVGTIPKKILRKGEFHDIIVMSMVL